MVYRNNLQGESLSRNYSASTTRLHATEMRTAPILLEVLRFIAIKITCKVLHYHCVYVRVCACVRACVCVCAYFFNDHQRLTDITCHDLETTRKENTTRETSQAVERRPGQILERHNRAGQHQIG